MHGFGIVYLHGKGGWPGALDGGILSSLADEGALVATPEMPWSFHRKYAATYDQAMAEIDAAVAGLKTKGAKKIVVMGHSLGANAAIGYAARHPDLAAVVALAPGHLPEAEGLRSHTREAHRGSQAARRRRAGRRAAALSRHGARHPADGDGDAARLPEHVRSGRPGGDPQKCSGDGAGAVLVGVVGLPDPIDRRGPEYAFNAGAKNPKSQDIKVFAGHLTTPLAARKQVVEWINSL